MILGYDVFLPCLTADVEMIVESWCERIIPSNFKFEVILLVKSSQLMIWEAYHSLVAVSDPAQFLCSVVTSRVKLL